MKKWLALFLALVLVLGMTACGASPSGSKDDAKPSQSTENNDKPSPTTGDWRVTKESRFNADGSIDEWYESEYDANGTLLKKTWFNADGSIKFWYEFEYDTHGNLIKRTQFNPDGSIYIWIEFEYDANGNRIKESNFNADGSIRKWTEYEYQYFANAPKREG